MSGVGRSWLQVGFGKVLLYLAHFKIPGLTLSLFFQDPLLV